MGDESVRELPLTTDRSLPRGAAKQVPNAIAQLLERHGGARRIGPFLLEKPLGQGGFAPVWLAREQYEGTTLRFAAVKLFSLEGAATGVVRERILDEARSLCAVEHPNVVRFYALAIDEETRVMGLAMEHLAGVPLNARLETEAPLTMAATLALGIGLSAALGAVHRVGIVHGDVKPANIIEVAGTPRLIDFGIAAASIGEIQTAETPNALSPDETPRIHGCAAGTPGYVDPTSARTGAPASYASDLYSCGATLFECLTGHVPAAAQGSLDPKILLGHVPPPDVREFRPDVPAAFAELLAALLDPDRTRRPPSADHVAARLASLKRTLTVGTESLPPEDTGPFRGLGRFEVGDRDLFFGREGEIAATLAGLQSRGFVALVGPSGSGKSSLIRAGILPAFLDAPGVGFPAVWDHAFVDLGAHAAVALDTALECVVPKAVGMRGNALVDALCRHVDATGRGILLVVDPLEALVVASPGREEVAMSLGAIGTRAVVGVRVVAAARRDMLDPLLALPMLGQTLARGLVLIEPLSAATQRDGVERALAAYGYRFEDEALAEEVFADLNTTVGAMPLAEFSLLELWKRRDRENRLLTRDALRALGGVAGALERHAEATLASLPRRSQQTARDVLLALTTAEGTRAIRSVDELETVAGAEAQAVIDTLLAARLVAPAGETGTGLTLAHETLLLHWSRLRDWVEQARDDRRLGEELERDAARWQQEPDAAPRWRGRRLALAEERMGRRGVRLSKQAEAYLRANRRAERVGRIVAVLVAAVVVLALAALSASYVNAVRAEREAAERDRASAEKERAILEKGRAIAEAERATVEKALLELRVSALRNRFPLVFASILNAASTSPAPTTMTMELDSRGLRVEFLPQPTEPIVLRVDDRTLFRLREAGREGQAQRQGQTIITRSEHALHVWGASTGALEKVLHRETEAKGTLGAWEIEGAQPRVRGESVAFEDETGRARLFLSAPVAYDGQGQRVPTRLAVEGTRVTLTVEARGEVVVRTVWTTVAPLGTPRIGHTATRLDDGRVLVVGGNKEPSHEAYDADSDLPPGAREKGNRFLRSAEIYDPKTGLWSETGSLHTARVYAQATLLLDGRVLIVGGQGDDLRSLANAELFDPATGTFAATAPPATRRYCHALDRLADGRVLVTGGLDSSTMLASVEIYDPVKNRWTQGHPLRLARYAHTQTTLADATVLVVGGASRSSTGLRGGAERYDPVTDTWSDAGVLTTARYAHSATRLDDGRVVVIGGFSIVPVATTEIYDPRAAAWSVGASLAEARSNHVAVGLGAGRVLVLGGEARTRATGRMEMYDAGADRFVPAGMLRDERIQPKAIRLLDGSVLVVGGVSDGVPMGSVEVVWGGS